MPKTGKLGSFSPYDTNDRIVHGPEVNTSQASHVMRLGHVVLGTKDFREAEAWWKQHFGLITSDEIVSVLQTQLVPFFWAQNNSSSPSVSIN